MSSSGISWAICKSAPRSRQTTTPAYPPLCFFTGRMPFLPPSQQCQSTEGMSSKRYHKSAVYWTKYSTQQHQTWFLGASAAGGNKCLFVAVHVHFLQLLTNHLRALINQHAFTPVSCWLQTDIFKIKKATKIIWTGRKITVRSNKFSLMHMHGKKYSCDAAVAIKTDRHARTHTHTHTNTTV